MRVAVLGASGGIGQSLALLLKLKLPHESTLLLYDLANVHGVAADLSHIDTNVYVEWAQGSLPPKPNDPELKRLLSKGGVDVVVICAGVPRKPGMTRDDLFKVNAGIIMDLVKTSVSGLQESPCFLIVTNPVNSTVPIAAETLKSVGKYNKNKLFGVTMLDGLRATRFINEKRVPLLVDSVPVIGGHSGSTIVPLFSQIHGDLGLNVSEWESLVKRVQEAGTEVVNAKAGKGSATLSMAEAGARFALYIVSALSGASNPILYAYVDTDGTHQLPYLAMPVAVSKSGIARRLPIGKMNPMEQKLFEVANRDIQTNIHSGVAFVRSKI
ncbi:glycosomal malate dehydrogenase [Perkinsela sp. CCAP 1560/4]|nr:glycosomal malate dehydrogenase [Perkinsela sp. CCAP 1560/4]|eukprot:KNH08154.1 glycosomal malate dehydrogenase [Perkinsela sp. CCAP 1560/4]